jgi:hypothetical protein
MALDANVDKTMVSVVGSSIASKGHHYHALAGRWASRIV